MTKKRDTMTEYLKSSPTKNINRAMAYTQPNNAGEWEESFDDNAFDEKMKDFRERIENSLQKTEK